MKKKSKNSKNPRKGNYRPRASEIGETMTSYLERSGMSISYIAGSLLQTQDSVRAIFEEGALPLNYRLFRRICEMIGVPESVIDEWSRYNTVYIYHYWDYVRPAAPPSEFFGRFLESKYKERGLSRQEIVDETGKTPGGLSRIFNCKSRLSWMMLCTVCEAINLTPEEFLREYENSRIQFYSYEFSRFIYLARRDKGFSKAEMAEALSISERRYEKIESGIISVFENELSSISTILNISLKKLIEYAKLAAIFQGNTPRRVKQKKIDKLLKKIGGYKYIDSDFGRVEGHTLVVLLNLIFLNCQDKYKADILYYMNNLFDSGSLSLKLYAPSSGLKEYQVIDRVREAQGHTYASLSSDADVSVSTVYDFLNGQSTPYIRTLVKVCDALGVSLTLALEAIAGDSAPKREVIELVDVMADIDTARKWIFGDQIYSSSYVSELFRIIFSKDPSYERYTELKGLNKEELE